MVAASASTVSFISPAPSVSSLLSHTALQPRFLASCTSVILSPITNEFAISYTGLFKYAVSIPVFGLRVGALSLGKVLSK